MSCQSQNCFTEDEIQGIFETFSKLTGICFPSIGTSFVPANTTVSTGFLLNNTGGDILQGDAISRIIIIPIGSLSSTGTSPYKPC